MLTRLTLMLALSLSACATTPKLAGGQDAPVEAKEAGPEAGLDARLTSYAYPHEVRFHALTVQGQELEMAYMDVAPSGEANGEVVVLLHGKNFSGAYWANTITPLLERGYRVLVPDQIGFGKSSKPRHMQYSLHALATFTAELMEERTVDRAHVVGHSMGGMLAARFALTYPERVRTLTMVNPIGLEDWKVVVPYKTVDWWYAGELEKTPEKVRAYMTASYFDGTWKPEYEPLVELQAGWIEGPDYDTIAWSSALHYEMIFTQPVVYEFKNIAAPTLLIIGGRDTTALGKPLVSPEVRATMGNYPELARAAEAAIPDATLELIEGVGHVPQYEAYDRYLGALVGFIGAGR